MKRGVLSYGQQQRFQAPVGISHFLSVDSPQFSTYLMHGCLNDIAAGRPCPMKKQRSMTTTKDFNCGVFTSVVDFQSQLSTACVCRNYLS